MKIEIDDLIGFDGDLWRVVAIDKWTGGPTQYVCSLSHDELIQVVLTGDQIEDVYPPIHDSGETVLS